MHFSKWSCIVFDFEGPWPLITEQWWWVDSVRFYANEMQIRASKNMLWKLLLRMIGNMSNREYELWLSDLNVSMSFWVWLRIWAWAMSPRTISAGEWSNVLGKMGKGLVATCTRRNTVYTTRLHPLTDVDRLYQATNPGLEILSGHR